MDHPSDGHAERFVVRYGTADEQQNNQPLGVEETKKIRQIWYLVKGVCKHINRVRDSFTEEEQGLVCTQFSSKRVCLCAFVKEKCHVPHLSLTIAWKIRLVLDLPQDPMVQRLRPRSGSFNVELILPNAFRLGRVHTSRAMLARFGIASLARNDHDCDFCHRIVRNREQKHYGTRGPISGITYGI